MKRPVIGIIATTHLAENRFPAQRVGERNRDVPGEHLQDQARLRAESTRFGRAEHQRAEHVAVLQQRQHQQ